MKDPALILHAGHPKTGSSALQSAFALSIDALAERGIHYPAPARLEEAQAGRITSGNFNPARVAQRYDAARREAPDAAAILLSNEACFRIYGEDRMQLTRLAERGVDITMLLFLRDPLDQVASGYAQGVKRGGVTRAFVPGTGPRAWLDRVSGCLDYCEELGIRLILRNYSRVADRLLPVTETALSLPAGTLTAPPVARVNRSLTRAELALMRELNGAIGKDAASRIADALCNELSQIAAETPDLARGDYDACVARLRPAVDALNPRLPPEARYRIAPYEEIWGDAQRGDAAGLTFSQAQLRVIATALSDVMGGSSDDPQSARPGPTGLARIGATLEDLRDRWSGRS